MSPEPWNDARARLEAAALGHPIEWPNERFVTPSPPRPWLSVQADGDVLEPIEIGPGAWEERGTLYVHVMVPAGTGSTTARQIAKDVANIYRGAAGYTVYRRASIGAGVPDENGLWFVTTVSIDWTYTDRPA